MTIDTINITFIEMKPSYHCCNATVEKIVGEEWDENSFEMINPVMGELCEKEFNRVNERRLYVSEWEVEGVGVTTDFGVAGALRSESASWWPWCHTFMIPNTYSTRCASV